MRISLINCLVAWCCLASLPAVAQETSEQIERAQKHFEQGAAHFFADDYDSAIAQFRAAQAVVPNPIFLYNIALAYVRLGNTRDALFHAKEAKRTGLGGQDAVQNDARIVALSQRLRAERVADDIKNRPVVVQTVEPPPTRTSIAPNGVVGWIGLGAGALGIAGLITSVVVEATLGPKVDEYKVAAARGDEAMYRDLRDEIEMRQSISKIALFAGGGLVVVGSALYLVDRYVLWEGVTIAPTATGVALSGSF